MTIKDDEVQIYAIGEVTKEYAFKIRFLLDKYELYDKSGIFIFPDGDEWEK